MHGKHLHNGLIYAASCGIFFLCILLGFERFYLTNDNIAILDNALRGMPVRYISVIWSALIEWAQTLLPETLNAYALLLYTCHFAGMMLLAFSLHRLETPPLLLACFMVPYAVFYAGFLIFLDYTSTAIMLGAHAIFAFAVMWLTSRPSIIATLAYALVIMLAGMIRIKSGVALMALGVPFMGFVWLCSNTSPVFTRASLRRLVWPVLLFTPLVIMTVTDSLYKNHYATPEYKHYEAFNQLRGKIHNNLDKPQTIFLNARNKELFAETGWNQGDYLNFFNWIFFDEQIYNTDVPRQHKLDKLM